MVLLTLWSSGRSPFSSSDPSSSSLIPPSPFSSFQVGGRALQQIPLQQLGSWHAAESVPLETPAPSPRLSWALPSCPGACFEDSVHSFFKEVLSLPRGPEPVPTGARATVVLQTDGALPAGGLREAWWEEDLPGAPRTPLALLPAPAVVGMISIPVRYTGKPSFVPLPRVTQQEGWSRVKHTHKPHCLCTQPRGHPWGCSAEQWGRERKDCRHQRRQHPSGAHTEGVAVWGRSSTGRVP